MLRVCALLLLLVVSQPSRLDAQSIPGADDPRLRESAIKWLHAEDAVEELWALGELAADGNVAARLLVSKIYRRFVPIDFPGLSREERLALIPPDRTGARSNFNPYSVQLLSLPPFAALAEMPRADTAEDWIALSNVVLNAGLRHRFFRQLGIALGRNEIAVEAAQFAETLVRSEEYELSYLQAFRAREPVWLDFLDQWYPERAEVRRTRWRSPAWSDEREEALLTDIREGRWSAILTLGLVTPFVTDFLAENASVEEYRKWSVSGPVLKATEALEAAPPDEDELSRIGELLILDASRSPYLQPMLRTCERSCSNVVPTCMAVGAGLGIYKLSMLQDLEPIISQREFYSSKRAALELLVNAGYGARRVGYGPSWMQMPSCFQDAASAAANVVHPE